VRHSCAATHGSSAGVPADGRFAATIYLYRPRPRQLPRDRSLPELSAPPEAGRASQQRLGVCGHNLLFGAGYANEPETYRATAADLFAALADRLHVPAGAEYPLADAARAHLDLEVGHTMGGVLLVP